MQAVYEKHGKASDVIVIKDIPLPEVYPADVVIAVHAAALNPVDWCARFCNASVNSSCPAALTSLAVLAGKLSKDICDFAKAG